MPRNPYIRDNQREQKLLEDLNVETIRSMGRDVYYIPRTLNNQDKIFGEDASSSFNSAYLIDMYHEDSQAFGGEGDIIGKFGIDVKDRASFRVARRTFMQEVTKRNSFIDRPREGDLIYYPLSGSLFEITFVEHENPLYQLGQLYSFVLFVETFAYNNEDFATGKLSLWVSGAAFPDILKITLKVKLYIKLMVNGAMMKRQFLEKLPQQQKLLIGMQKH